MLENVYESLNARKWCFSFYHPFSLRPTSSGFYFDHLSPIRMFVSHFHINMIDNESGGVKRPIG